MSEAFEEIEPCEFSLEEIVGEHFVLRPLGEVDACRGQAKNVALPKMFLRK